MPPQLNRRQSNIDTIPRNPEDKSYHCPICNSPFTRRSNLRRHFVIHTRSMPFKCTSCNVGFTRSEDFHYHVLNCRASPTSPVGLDYAESPVYFDNQSSGRSTPCEPSTPFSQQELDHAFADFFSSLNPEACMSPLSASATQFLSPQLDATSLDSASTPPRDSQMRLPSSSSLESGTLWDTPYAHHRTSSKPYPVRRKRGEADDQLVYTRRQVEEMMNTLTTCFVEKIEGALRGSSVDIMKQNRSEPATCTPDDLAWIA